MSKFDLTCPHCGFDLEADTKYIGAVVACLECGGTFLLEKPKNIVLPPRAKCPFCKEEFPVKPESIGNIISCKCCKRCFALKERNLVQNVFDSSARKSESRSGKPSGNKGNRKTSSAPKPQSRYISRSTKCPFCTKEIVIQLFQVGAFVTCSGCQQRFLLEEENVKMTIVHKTPPSSQTNDSKGDSYKKEASKDSQSINNGSITKTAPSINKTQTLSENKPASVKKREERPALSLEAVLLQEYPDGFLLNRPSLKICETTAGRTFSQKEIDNTTKRTFTRSDGVMLLPEMTADESTIAGIIDCATQWLKSCGCFSLSNLYDKFAIRLRNLPFPEFDFHAFFESVILPQLSYSARIIGKKSSLLCIPNICQDDEAKTFVADRLRRFFIETGDAVSVSDLVLRFTAFNADFIDSILSQKINDAISFNLDGQKYWKLLEHYYLPSDFTDAVSNIIDSIEINSAIASQSAITDELTDLYGQDFLSIYALEDDCVFRQVVSLTYNGPTHVWRSKIFVPEENSKIVSTNIADEFLQNRSGIFHESEFLDYAKEKRGLGNRSTLVRHYLRKKCIRVSEFYWIGIDDFVKKSNYTKEYSTKISNIMLEYLGNKPYLSLGLLPNSIYDLMPEIKLSDTVLYWNGYLLVSIISRLIPELNIANDDPSPYTITAVLLPSLIEKQDDVIEYVLEIYKQSGFHPQSLDEIFDYLKENQIRMMKTKRLMTRIRDFWRKNDV